MVRKVSDFLESHMIDCLWIDHITMAQFIPSDYKGKLVLEAHNVDSEFFKKMFLKDSFIHWRCFALYEWIKYIFFQKKYINRFNKILAASEDDKIILERISKKKNVEFFFPKIEFKRIEIKKRNPYTILFVGSLCWYPNKDGIYWFLKKIYPIIIKTCPKLNIWIVGRTPRRFIFPIFPNVNYFGHSKSLDYFYSKANIFVVPIRYGSGIRIKVLEAIAYKMNIISTTEGIKGLPINYIQGKVRIADTPSDIAREIVRAIKNE